MTGPHHQSSREFRESRIKKLSEEGLTASIIAERMGLSRGMVYGLQVKYGFRIPIPRKKKK